MLCKSCGKRLRENEKFCTVCGYYNDGEEVEASDLDNEEEKEEEYDIDIGLEKEEDLNEFNIDPITDEERKNGSELDEYIESYVKEDYKLIKKSPINIYALLFNWIYVLYRKLYITGIIGLFITYIIVMLFKLNSLFFIAFCMLLLGLFFNKYYLFIIKIRVKRILKKYEGSDTDNLKEVCQEKGGVNVIIALIIYILFLCLIIFSLFFNNHKPYQRSKYWNETTENQANCMSLTKQSYQLINKDNPTDIVIEGTCQVLLGSPKQYSIILKISSNKKLYYYYFLANGKKLEYQNDTKKLEELSKKKQSNILTKEEEKQLMEKQDIITNYSKVTSKSKYEDQLIKDNKDTSAKKNFIFGKEEIMR